MTTEFNDGGPAFPCDGGHASGLHPAPGMSLLDWFAGMALQSYLAGRNTDDRDSRCEYVARTCYAYAREMLAESARLRTARVQPVAVAAQADEFGPELHGDS